MHRINIEHPKRYFGVAIMIAVLSACGGGGSSSASSAASSSTPTTSSTADTGPAIDPATGSVSAAEVTCQGACVSLVADGGASTD